MRSEALPATERRAYRELIASLRAAEESRPDLTDPRWLLPRAPVVKSIVVPEGYLTDRDMTVLVAQMVTAMTTVLARVATVAEVGHYAPTELVAGAADAARAHDWDRFAIFYREAHRETRTGLSADEARGRIGVFLNDRDLLPAPEDVQQEIADCDAFEQAAKEIEGSLRALETGKESGDAIGVVAPESRLITELGQEGYQQLRDEQRQARKSGTTPPTAKQAPEPETKPAA